MSDQGLWFKLWCSSLDDPDLDNLDIADFGRWCKLGALVKRHGHNGTLAIRPPARGLCSMFQVETFAGLIDALRRLPGVNFPSVADETLVMFQFANWLKFQGDLSTVRVQRFRAMKRLRREEKRGEEKRRETPPLTVPPPMVQEPDSQALSPRRAEALAVLDFLNRKTGKRFRPVRETVKLIEARLKSGITPDQLHAIIAIKIREWSGDPKTEKWLRPATLFGATKCEQYIGELPAESADA